jgi:hypothetical protein
VQAVLLHCSLRPGCLYTHTLHWLSIYKSENLNKSTIILLASLYSCESEEFLVEGLAWNADICVLGGLKNMWTQLGKGKNGVVGVCRQLHKWFLYLTSYQSSKWAPIQRCNAHKTKEWCPRVRRHSLSHCLWYIFCQYGRRQFFWSVCKTGTIQSSFSCYNCLKAQIPITSHFYKMNRQRNALHLTLLFYCG